MAKLSQYEIDREANIARNRALLEQLELKQAVEGLGFSKPKEPKKSKAQPVQPSKKAKKEPVDVPVTRRQSARLRHIPEPDESPGRKRKREAEVEEQRAKEAEARIEAEERERIAKKPRRDDLSLAILRADEDPKDTLELEQRLKDAQEQPDRSGESDSTSPDNTTETRAVATLKEQLKDLRVVSRAKVTLNRVYCSAYHPDVQKDLIFFGDKHGQLGIWDARAPREEVEDEDGDVSDTSTKEDGKYWRLQSISCIKFNPANYHTVYTSAYDCSVRNLCFTTGVSREIYSSEDILLSSFDLTPTGQEMWISDAAGGLTHLDMRQSKASSRWYGLSDAKIGSVSINPARPNFLVTASNSRALRIWDVRNLQKMVLDVTDKPASSSASLMEKWAWHKKLDPPQTDAEASPIEFARAWCPPGEWRHDKSVSSAYWDPRGKSIVSTSYDDAIRLWDIDASSFSSADPFHSSRPFSRIAHNCQTGKWLTILRAQWSPNADVYPHFTIGHMSHHLDIRSGKGELLKRLSDTDKISAVQAVTCSHPSIVQRAASGNASGRCVLWAPANDS
ncbi:WD40 repeat-like protein [Hymenopellis radicata]|nr:WD40 repeat-like protein [Hymenopellis radicata]